MIILLLSCAKIDFNIKTRREEISEIIARDNVSALQCFSYNELHKENDEGLIAIEEAIHNEKIEAITILLKKVSFADAKRIACKAIQINNIEIYKILKENKLALLPFCLKEAKSENNIKALLTILEVMEATELEREILLGTKESIKLGGELKEGNESIIAVSEEEIFETIKGRANGKVFLECVKLCDKEKVLKLIDKVDINDRTKRGFTALMLASEQGHEEIVSLLLKAGAEVDEQQEDGFTALIIASQNGHERIVSLLLKAGAKVDEKQDNAKTALMWASKNGHEAVVSILLQAGAKIDENDGCTALMLASQNGHEGVINLLLEAGAEIDDENQQGSTALMDATYSGQERAVNLLLQAGANVDEKDEGGWTALMIASTYCHQEIVSLLLKAGARVDETQKNGFTALMIASRNGNEEIVRLLLQAGVNVGEKEKDGLTALMIASQNGHEVIVSLLLKAGAEVNEKNNNGYTALMMSSAQGDEKIVSLLLQSGAKIDEKAKDGRTALMMTNNECLIKCLKVVKLLISKGANPKVVVEGNFLAYLNIEYVFELLDLGLISINDINEDGMTNFYSILKGLEKQKTNLKMYKIFLIELLTRYNTNRLF